MMLPLSRTRAAVHILLMTSVAAGALAPMSFGAGPPDRWPQWGGLTRDFKSNVTGLADRWPEDGPKRIWSRPLGDGYSSIVADSGRLYTMYREGGEEIVIALSADDGKTIWEHRYRATTYSGQTDAYGQGPNATPLILDDRIVTIGFTGIMHCLDIGSGKPIWSHDLVKDFGGAPLYYGYSGSPMAYKGTIITLVGGEKYGVVALRQSDGSLVWQSKPSDISYAAPVLINVDGQDQFVFFSTKKVIGVDPTNGSFLWSHPVVNFCRTNCTSAIWGKDNLLWAATKGVGGTRVLKLTQSGGKTEVEEVWLNRKIRVYHWNAVRVGDHIYTSSGGGQMFLSVIDVRTGKVVERKRGFGSTNVIYADGKLILLDDSGKLALAKVSPENIKILSSVQLNYSVSWTPPTLVGTTLYVRDRMNIVALDLS